MLKKAALLKILFVIMIAGGLTLSVLLLYSNGENAEKDNSTEILTGELEKKGFEVSLTEFQKSRSEWFSYSQLPTILLVDDEEIFIFQYDSQNEMLQDLKLTNDFDAKSTYYSDTNIFLYRKDNDEIIELLKSNLNQTEK